VVAWAWAMKPRIFLSAAALPFLLCAVELDPNSASVIEEVGITYTNLDQPDRANEYLTRAFQLRDRTSEREKLSITALYYEIVTGEADKAIEAYREWEESYPRDPSAPINLGALYAIVGRYEPAVKQTQRVLQLNPDNSFAYGNLATFLLAVDRFDEAHKTVDAATARNLDRSSVHYARYELAFLESDAKPMAEQVA
jgi:tetratricopeptide (TPR) repeat protein